MARYTFNWSTGDRASYAFGDAAGAVRMAREHGTVAVDIETRGLGADQWSMTAFSIGTADHAIVLDPSDTGHREAIRDAVAAATTLVLHNASFDIPILYCNGLVRISDIDKVRDTLITARMAYPGDTVRRGLADCCARYLGPEYSRWKTSLEDGYRAVTGRSKSQMFKELGLESPALIAYSAFDVVMTARLYEALPGALRQRLSDHPFDPERTGDAAYLDLREQVVNRMLLKRSARGIALDFGVVDEIKDEMAGVVSQCDQQLADFGVDVSLGRELLKKDFVRVLDRKGLLPRSHKRLKDGSPSADRTYLDRIQHPMIDVLERRSKADRFASDYADKLVGLSREGRIHPQVAVMVATTGRMSYSDPPLQQFPAGVRRMLKFDVPATSLDWSSIEPVLAANFAGDTGVLEAFESGGDLYLPVAADAGVPRSDAKTVLLAQLYGRGVPSLAMRLEITEDEAAALVRRVMGRMPQIARMSRAVRSVGDAHGVVQTMSGRVIPLPADPRTGNTRFLGYKAVNYLIQGSALDLLSEALFAMHRRGLDDALLAAVHDEIICDTDAAAEVEEIMTTPPVPLIEAAGRTPVLRVGRSDIGRYWLPKGD
jgi:DNA polymerase-1